MSDNDPRSLDEPNARPIPDAPPDADAGAPPPEGGVAVPPQDAQAAAPPPDVNPTTPLPDAYAAAPPPYVGVATSESVQGQGMQGDVTTKKRSKVGWILAGSIAGAALVVGAIVAVAAAMSPGTPVEAAATPSKSPSETDVTPSAEPSAEPTAETAAASLGFAEGDALDPLTMVGWQFSMGADGAWVPSPDAGEGEIVFLNSDNACTAQYWQETYDAKATDDLSATDEFLAAMSGATEEEMDEYAFDGHFALGGGLDDPDPEGDVATRTLLWSDDQSSYLLTTRVFHGLDYATSTMSNAYTLELQCGVDLDPLDVVDSLDEVAKVSVDR